MDHSSLFEGLATTEFNVPEAEQQGLLRVLGPMRDEIVEVDSSDTGTALPESYQAAPALE